MAEPAGGLPRSRGVTQFLELACPIADRIWPSLPLCSLSYPQARPPASAFWAGCLWAKRMGTLTTSVQHGRPIEPVTGPGTFSSCAGSKPRVRWASGEGQPGKATCLSPSDRWAYLPAQSRRTIGSSHTSKPQPDPGRLLLGITSSPA